MILKLKIYVYAYIIVSMICILLKYQILWAQTSWLPGIWTGNIYEILEQGYWESIYEKELGAAVRAPIILSLNIMSEYSDNIFLKQTDVSRDINLQKLRYSLSFDYKCRIIRYANIDPAPGFNLRNMNYIGHVMNLTFSRIISRRCKLGINNRYISSRRPRDMYLGTNRISKAKFYRNWFTPFFEYYLSDRTAVRIKLLYDMLRYQERISYADEDSNGYSIETVFGHILNEKTQFYINQRFFARKYDYSSGYLAYQDLIGLRRAIRPFFWFEGACGLQIRNFDREQKDEIENFKKFVAIAKIARETPKSYTEFMFTHFPPDIGEGNNYYSINRYSFNLFYLASTKLKCAISVFYESLNYYHEKGIGKDWTIKKRKDERYGGDAFLEFEINKYISISLGYARLQRESNMLGADFTENRISLSIKGKIELWGK